MRTRFPSTAGQALLLLIPFALWMCAVSYPLWRGSMTNTPLVAGAWTPARTSGAGLLQAGTEAADTADRKEEPVETAVESLTELSLDVDPAVSSEAVALLDLLAREPIN